MRGDNIMSNLFYDPSFILAHKRAWNFLLGTRVGGKSFGIKLNALTTFIDGKKDGRKDCLFALLNRKVDDVKLTSAGFFDDVLDIYFSNQDTMEFKMATNGFGRYYFNGELCGYSMCIKHYVRYKKMAELQTIENIIMDEFLSEDGDYLKGEVDMVRNIYTTIARGGGKFVRKNVYMYFISNTVSMHNPYFEQFPEIKRDFKFNTKRLVREKFVLEIFHNENASKAIRESDFGKSIEGTEYASYIMDNKFYLDNTEFVEIVPGEKRYVMNVIMGGKYFAIYHSEKKSVFYVSEKVDKSRETICFDNADHDINYIMVAQNESMIKHFKKLYQYNCFRFENLSCKIMFLTMIKMLKK